MNVIATTTATNSNEVANPLMSNIQRILCAKAQDVAKSHMSVFPEAMEVAFMMGSTDAILDEDGNIIAWDWTIETYEEFYELDAYSQGYDEEESLYKYKGHMTLEQATMGMAQLYMEILGGSWKGLEVTAEQLLDGGYGDAMLDLIAVQFMIMGKATIG